MTLMDGEEGKESPKKTSQSTCTKVETRRKHSSRSSSTKSREKRKKDSEKGAIEEGEIAKELWDNFPAFRDNFNILSKVGEGTFSKVYLAQLKRYPDETVAVKHIVPTSSPARVRNELACLQKLGGKRNVIGVHTTLRNNDHIAFILPYFKHDKFQTFFRRLTTNEIKDYMKNLFAALEHVHQYNIIHRDIKPSNFLHSRATKKYSLVDFGLAMQVPGTDGFLSDDDNAGCSKAKAKNNSKERPSSYKSKHGGEVANAGAKSNVARGDKCPARGTKYRSETRSKSDVLCKIGHQPGHSPTSVCSFCCSRSGQVAPRAGTPGFRSPEVLMKLPNQTTAVDIWSAGVILLSFLSGRYPFFKAKDDLSSLAQIITVFGSKEAADAGSLMGKDLTCSSSVPPMELKSLCEKLRQKTCKCGEVYRKKRKHSSPDGKSKRARIEHFGEDYKSRKKVCEPDNGSQLNADSKDETHSSKVGGNYLSPGKRQGLRSSDRTEELTAPIENSSLQSKVSVTSVDNTSSELKNNNVVGFNQVSGDCYCIPDSAYDLLAKCLKLDPSQRINASDALNHQFLTS